MLTIPASRGSFPAWCRAARCTRPARSVSMASICARTGARIGESGRASARLTARSRLARCSSLSVSELTSCSRVGTADVLALVLLLDDVGEVLAQLLARPGVAWQRFHGEGFFERLA